MSFKIDWAPMMKIIVSSGLVFVSLYIVSFYVSNLILGGIVTGLFTLLYFLFLYLLNFYGQDEIKLLDFVSQKVPLTAKPAGMMKNILLKKINSKSN